MFSRFAKSGVGLFRRVAPAIRQADAAENQRATKNLGAGERLGKEPRSHHRG